MARSCCGTIFAAALLAVLAPAQEAPTEFEVASLKRLAQPSNIHRSGGGPGTDDPVRLMIENATLKGLLVSAHRLRSLQILGPDWIDTEHYNLTANVPPGTTREQMRVMMQNLLRRRFQLVLHHEMKDFQVYELVVGKQGSKLNPSLAASQANPSEGNQIVDGRIKETCIACTMDYLASLLGGRLKAPVFNSTGLTGMYDMAFELAPDWSVPGDPFTEPIRTVLENQFGLRLQPARRKMDVLVIDHAEKNPTEE